MSPAPENIVAGVKSLSHDRQQVQDYCKCRSLEMSKCANQMTISHVSFLTAHKAKDAFLFCDSLTCPFQYLMSPMLCKVVMMSSAHQTGDTITFSCSIQVKSIDSFMQSQGGMVTRSMTRGCALPGLIAVICEMSLMLRLPLCFARTSSSTDFQ